MEDNQYEWLRNYEQKFSHSEDYINKFYDELIKEI